MTQSLSDFWDFLYYKIQGVEPERFIKAVRFGVEKNIKHLPSEDALAVYIVLVLVDAVVELNRMENEGG